MGIVLDASVKMKESFKNYSDLNSTPLDISRNIKLITANVKEQKSYEKCNDTFPSIITMKKIPKEMI